MRKKITLAIGAMLAIGMLAGAPVKANAQDIGGTVIPSLELDSADVREALRALFKNVGVSYSIAPEVQGTVTVSLRNVTFEAALQNILKQVNATYRVEGGIYQIVLKETTQAPGQADPGNLGPAAPSTVTRRLKIRSADPQMIITLLSGSQSTGIAPEESTINNTRSGGGGMGGGGFGGGRGGGRGF